MAISKAYDYYQRGGDYGCSVVGMDAEVGRDPLDLLVREIGGGDNGCGMIDRQTDR